MARAATVTRMEFAAPSVAAPARAAIATGATVRTRAVATRVLTLEAPTSQRRDACVSTINAISAAGGQLEDRADLRPEHLGLARLRQVRVTAGVERRLARNRHGGHGDDWN